MPAGWPVARNMVMRRDHQACRSSNRYNHCPKARPTCAFCRFQPSCASFVRRAPKKAFSRPAFSTAWLTLSNGGPWKRCPNSWGRNRVWCSGHHGRPLGSIYLTTCCKKMKVQPALERHDGFLLFTVVDLNSDLSSRFIQS